MNVSKAFSSLLKTALAFSFLLMAHTATAAEDAVGGPGYGDPAAYADLLVIDEPGIVDDSGSVDGADIGAKISDGGYDIQVCKILGGDNDGPAYVTISPISLAAFRDDEDSYLYQIKDKNGTVLADGIVHDSKVIPPGPAIEGTRQDVNYVQNPKPEHHGFSADPTRFQLRINLSDGKGVDASRTQNTGFIRFSGKDVSDKDLVIVNSQVSCNVADDSAL